MSDPIVLMGPQELAKLISSAVEPVVRKEVEKAVRLASEKEYLTQAEVSAIIGWTTRQLAYKRSNGELPFIKRGRTVLYRTEDVFAWLEEGYVPKKSAGR